MVLGKDSIQMVQEVLLIVVWGVWARVLIRVRIRVREVDTRAHAQDRPINQDRLTDPREEEEGAWTGICHDLVLALPHPLEALLTGAHRLEAHHLVGGLPLGALRIEAAVDLTPTTTTTVDRCRPWNGWRAKTRYARKKNSRC